MKDFVAFDFETSGLNFRTDQIIEACVCVVRGGEMVSVFNTLVQPNAELRAKGLDPVITEMTGHTIEDLANGMTEEDLAALLDVLIFAGKFGAPPLVAYNALFDLSFLDTLWRKYGIEGLDTVPMLDPLTIARDRHRYPHKLENICAKYGITLENAHTAYDDTLALVDLVHEMVAEDTQQRGKDWKPVHWYINKAGYLRKYEEPEWVPPGVALYPQGPLPAVTHTAKSKLKPKPSYSAIAVNNAARRKKLPDFAKMPPEEFSKDFMPEAFIHKHIQEKIDAYFENPFSYGWQEVCVPGITTEEGSLEFDRVRKYLSDVHKVTNDNMHSFLDTPDEAVIEFRKPKGPIEINEDDLPF